MNGGRAKEEISASGDVERGNRKLHVQMYSYLLFGETWVGLKAKNGIAEWFDKPGWMTAQVRNKIRMKFAIPQSAMLNFVPQLSHGIA